MKPPRPFPGTVLATGILAAGLIWSAWQIATAVRLDGPGGSVTGLAWRVNLNTASAAELELLPGVYTVVGHRNGYRDVRLTLRVKPGDKATTLEVVCTETI